MRAVAALYVSRTTVHCVNLTVNVCDFDRCSKKKNALSVK